MTGHAPAATVAAVNERLARGITAMLPTEDAAAVGEEMQRRFGLRDWQFTLSATDANRFVIRICRQITGRPKILVHNHCYHGSVDETVATLVDGEVRPREGSVGPAGRRRRDHHGWSRSTTSTASSASSRTATSPAC